MVRRAQIVLAAAPGYSNARLARDLEVNVDTVRLWRDRWVARQGMERSRVSVAERVQDAPRPGAKPTFSQEQRCQIAALAGEAPHQAERPISQWTGREGADERKARGIVTEISPRHAARLLTQGASNRTASGTG
jgi:putative transposase